VKVTTKMKEKNDKKKIYSINKRGEIIIFKIKIKKRGKKMMKKKL